MEACFDVVIAGGGILGTACAYFLARDDNFNGTIAVVEPDPCYTKCATTLSASSIRQQFSTPINISISQFGIDFLREASQVLAIDNVEPDICLIESSYMYLASETGRSVLRSNTETQKSHGVPVELCKSSELKSRYPWLNVEDVVAGSVTENGEGWFDSYQLLMAMKNKARELNVKYIESRVEDITVCDSGDIQGVSLADGSYMKCGYLVNAAGTRARDLSALVGVDLPVFPRKRCIYVFDCKAEIDGCPLVVDPSGLWFRPEGQQFICGFPPDPDDNVELNDFDVDPNLFEDRMWPLLANRVPEFSEIKLRNFWAGHYDYNIFDQNAIVGPHGLAENFIIANGFSGHGLQQAPAIGRGISEYITYSQYRTLDLSPLSFSRIEKNSPLIEMNVI